MIEREVDADGIVTLRLAHGRANALDVELLAALDGELDAAAGARALVLTGSGRIFSAGVDLFRVTEGGETYVRRFFPLLGGVIRRLFALPLPVVAAVNGHAVAGGAVVTLAADYRLMAAGGGRIGVPELLVGVPFPAAPLEVVRFAVAPDRVQALVYTGRALTPGEAREQGLVDEVVEGEALSARAREVALQLASLPAEAFRLTKRHLRSASLERMDRLSAAHDAGALAVWSAPETQARIRDYLARTLRR